MEREVMEVKKKIYSLIERLTATAIDCVDNKDGILFIETLANRAAKELFRDLEVLVSDINIACA